PRAMRPAAASAKMTTRRAIAAIRRGSRRRDVSRRRARLNTPARRRVGRSTSWPRECAGTAPFCQRPQVSSHPPGMGPVERAASAMLWIEISALERGCCVADGTVMIIGGAEDKVRDRVVLNRFVSLAGGTDATIAVISTASSLGAEAGERYKQ